MRHAIVDKLRAELEKGVESEAQVVYILVEIRKLMEYSERRESYLPLQFFCDWMLHFLIDHLLPVDPVRKAAPWITFLRRYLDVVSDCPIQSDRVALKHVDKIVLNCLMSRQKA